MWVVEVCVILRVASSHTNMYGVGAQQNGPRAGMHHVCVCVQMACVVSGFMPIVTIALI